MLSVLIALVLLGLLAYWLYITANARKVPAKTKPYPIAARVRKTGVRNRSPRRRNLQHDTSNDSSASSNDGGAATSSISRNPRLFSYAPAQPSPLRLVASRANSSTSSASPPEKIRYPALAPRHAASFSSGSKPSSSINNVKSEAIDAQQRQQKENSAPALLEQGDSAEAKSRKRPIDARSEASFANEGGNSGTAASAPPPAHKRTKADSDGSRQLSFEHVREQSREGKKRPAASEIGDDESQMQGNRERRRQGQQKSRRIGSGKDAQSQEAEGGDDVDMEDEESDTVQDQRDVGMQTASPAEKGLAKSPEQELDDDEEEHRMREEARKRLQARQPKAASNKAKGKTAQKAPKSKAGPGSASSDEEENHTAAREDKKPGDKWKNAYGDWFQMQKDGSILRQTQVYEEQLKYKMPKDSKHPDAKVTHLVLVDRWLTETQWRTAKDKLLLAGQEAEREERDNPTIVAEDDDIEMGDASNDSLDAISANTTTSDPFYALGPGLPSRSSSRLSSLSFSPRSNISSPRIARSSSNSINNSPFASRLKIQPRSRLSIDAEYFKRKEMQEAEEQAQKEAALKEAAQREAALKEAAEKEAAQRRLAEQDRQREEERSKAAQAAAAAAAPVAATGDAKAAPAVPSFSFGPTTPAVPDSSKPVDQSKGETVKAPFFTFDTAPAVKPAGPAASAQTEKSTLAPLFSFGTSSQTTSAAAPSVAFTATNPPGNSEAPKFSFSTSTSSPATIEASTISLPSKPVSSSPSFTFGQTPKKPADISAAASPASNGNPVFAFGTVAPASNPSTANTDKGSSAITAAPTFSFGKTPSAAAPAASTDQTNPSKPLSFSFGSSNPTSSTPSFTNQAEQTRPALSFGSPSTASKPTQDTTKPAFSFSSTPAAPSSQSEGKPSLFTFGKSPQPATALPQTSGDKPTFSFGMPSGATGASNGVISGPGSTPATKPSFTFGTPSSSSTSASKPTFTFGASKASQ